MPCAISEKPSKIVLSMKWRHLTVTADYHDVEWTRWKLSARAAWIITISSIFIYATGPVTNHQDDKTNRCTETTLTIRIHLIYDSQDEIHPPNSSVNKVNAEEMQDQAPENIIRKRPINRSKVSNQITYRRERESRTNLSCETVTAESSPSPPANRAFFPLELGLFSFLVEFVCMRKLAVRTN